MPTVIVVGASRGIGLEFVRQYLANGWKVHCTVRNSESADAVRSLGASVHFLERARLKRR